MSADQSLNPKEVSRSSEPEWRIEDTYPWVGLAVEQQIAREGQQPLLGGNIFHFETYLPSTRSRCKS